MMGKKSKNNNITVDGTPTESKQKDGEKFVKPKRNKNKLSPHSSFSDNNSATVDNVNSKLNSKKKHSNYALNGDVHPNSTNVRITSVTEEILSSYENKKKRKKKPQSLKDQEAKVETNTNNINETIDTPIFRNKKKKRSMNNLSTEEESKLKPNADNTNETIDAPNIPKKKKKRSKNNLSTEEEFNVETNANNINKTIDALNIPKNKKKKSKNHLSVEDKNEKGASIELDAQKLKVKKKKEVDATEKVEEIMSENDNLLLKKSKKRQKKKKSQTDILNEEDSQVTEEDIDRFCDELDEEDNKQYEDWVQLLEASLPPRRTQ